MFFRDRHAHYETRKRNNDLQTELQDLQMDIVQYKILLEKIFTSKKP